MTESNELTLREIADRLNKNSNRYKIGKLQYLRKEIKNLGKRMTGPIFSQKSVKEDYAFHCGGRPELQFNIGIEEQGFRHGVAFSFETSRSFPSIDELAEKVKYFNEYLTANPSDFEGFKMWVWQKTPRKRSEERSPSPIQSNTVALGRFIFLGKIAPIGDFDVDKVLEDFDQLLNLYEFVESGGKVLDGKYVATDTPLDLSPVSENQKTADSWMAGFKAGHVKYAERSTVSFIEKTIDIEYRHNHLQNLIYPALVSEFGKGCVATEQRAASGGEIDIAIRDGKIRILVELKVASLARWCIREALGQLLEYAYFKEPKPPTEIWVIGTGECTQHDAAYLKLLRSKLNLPIFYRCFDAETLKLAPKV